MLHRFVNHETDLINQWMEIEDNYQLLYDQLLKIFEENIIFFSDACLRLEVNQQFQNLIKIWVNLQVDDFTSSYNPMLSDMLHSSLDLIDYWEIAEYWIDCVLM